MGKAPKDLKPYAEHYSEKNLWKKIGSVAKSAGKKGIYNVLLLYYVLMSDKTPTKYKAMIIGALGYFIFPLDIIPDIIPTVGYTDDITAIAGVVVAVAKSISPEIKEQVKAKLEEWFGKYDEAEIEDVIN